MKLLLDTHIFLWLNQAPERIPAHFLKLCEDIENVLFLSPASAWEIQIKHQLGKLALDAPLSAMIERQIQENGLNILPILLPHIYALSDLENHHNDPFDRLLIAQAKTESMMLLTMDSKIRVYSGVVFA